MLVLWAPCSQQLQTDFCELAQMPASCWQNSPGLACFLRALTIPVHCLKCRLYCLSHRPQSSLPQHLYDTSSLHCCCIGELQQLEHCTLSAMGMVYPDLHTNNLGTKACAEQLSTALLLRSSISILAHDKKAALGARTQNCTLRRCSLRSADAPASSCCGASGALSSCRASGRITLHQQDVFSGVRSNSSLPRCSPCAW